MFFESMQPPIRKDLRLCSDPHGRIHSRALRPGWIRYLLRELSAAGPRCPYSEPIVGGDVGSVREFDPLRDSRDSVAS